MSDTKSAATLITRKENQAMPLRIAILLLEHGQIPAQLAQTKVHSLTLTNLRLDLEQAMKLLASGEVVQLGTLNSKLLLLPALTAAQLKLHPHAYLAAMQTAKKQGQALKQALKQAKRQDTDLSHHRCNQLCNTASGSVNDFDALVNLVADIASRTQTHADGRQHFWFTAPHQGRVASLSLQLMPDNESLTLIVTQATGKRPPKSLLTAQRLLFVVAADDRTQLTLQLQQLEHRLANLSQEPLALLQLMHRNLSEFSQQHDPRFAITLQACGLEQLSQEITAVKTKLASFFAISVSENQGAKTTAARNQYQYKTPAGSYFTAAPLRQEKLAFVYPGVGTVYQQMLNELHQYFPELYAKLEQQGDLNAMLQADILYHSDKQLLTNMPLCNSAIAGVGASYLLTKLLTDEFGIQPSFALGYSMGEAAMWASLDVWQQPHQLIQKTLSDPLFTSVISGELTAVRQAWGLNEQEVIQWNSFVVRSQPEEIQALLPDYPRVYLAITQGGTCVIAGCQQSCQSLLKKLGKRGIAANRVTAMHTAPALSQRQQVSDFYCQPIKPNAIQHKVKFISAANSNIGIDAPLNQEIPLSSQLVADAISQTFCQPLDFNALIQSAASQGARLFVEVGSDRQNCTLIDKILHSETQLNYTTVATNAKGSDTISTLLKAIGQMISHRLPVKLDGLLQGLEHQIAQLNFTASLAEHASAQANTLFKEEA
ncbi:PfaB family protein [Shewanella sp. Isolate11]|uniref:PfaB family protein n=1 Tax=Shewanella sp. Isolate11 TaxID=2908530 RepID=UPI001EFD1328|nr:PfaB family protein [Shewanella sp. Isolate11]MCG9696121.1 PfaB family protein [Shewanella sp. Isolate11]